MKLTSLQLRNIIREEVGRLVLREALDPEQLASKSEDEIFQTMKGVADQLGSVVSQASKAMKGLSAAGGDRAAKGLAVHMKNVEYSMAGLQACVDALNSKMKG